MIGKDEGMVRGTGSLVLDDCSFHEKANLTDFDKERIITIPAQDGEVNNTCECTCTLHEFTHA